MCDVRIKQLSKIIYKALIEGIKRRTGVLQVDLSKQTLADLLILFLVSSERRIKVNTVVVLNALLEIQIPVILVRILHAACIVHDVASNVYSLVFRILISHGLVLFAADDVVLYKAVHTVTKIGLVDPAFIRLSDAVCRLVCVCTHLGCRSLVCADLGKK